MLCPQYLQAEQFPGRSGAILSSETFVLMHGSFHGGWIWTPMATELRVSLAMEAAPNYSFLNALRVPRTLTMGSLNR